MSHFYENVKETQFKVGVFVVICLLALFLSYSWLMDWFMGSRFDSYRVLFDQVSTLEKGNTVYYRGVRVGKVSNLTIRTDGILLDLLVDSKVKISTDAVFTIKDKDMMGTKSLEITPGISTQWLNDKEIYMGRGLPGFSDLISNVNTLSAKVELLIDQLNRDELFTEKLNKLLDNADVSLKDLNKLMHDLDNSDLLVSFTELRKASESLQALIKDNEENLTTTLGAAVNTFSKVDSLVVVTTEAMAYINSKLKNEDSNVNKLLSDEELYINLVKSTKELELLLNDIKAHPTKYFKFSVF